MGPGDSGENAYDDGKNWRKKKGQCPFTEMTRSEREKLPDSAFVFPDERTWPIHDKKHAKIALTWASWPQHKDVASKVKKAVYKKYPKLKKKEESNKMIGDVKEILEGIEGIAEARRSKRGRSYGLSSFFDNLIQSMDKNFSTGIIDEFIDEIVGGLSILREQEHESAQSADYKEILKARENARDSLATYIRDLARLKKLIDKKILEVNRW